MSHFSEEQLKELEAVFGLKRGETLPVRDGVARKETIVWWRVMEGPQQVRASEHWENIKEFPNVYQLKEPKIKVDYLD